MLPEYKEQHTIFVNPCHNLVTFPNTYILFMIYVYCNRVDTR